MAKLATTIETLATPLGVSVGHVDRLARVLKKHRLVPVSPVGGGSRAAHMGADALINLALGVAVADPLTAAPEFLAVYRSLVYLPPQPRPILNAIDQVLFPDEPWRPQPLAPIMAFPPKPDGLYTVAELITRILVALAAPDGDAFATAFVSSNFELTLVHATREPSADVTYLSGEKMRREMFIPFGQVAAIEGATAATGLLRTVCLRSSLFITMGQLLKDTQAHYENLTQTGE